MEGRLLTSLPSWAGRDGNAPVASAAERGPAAPMHDPPLEPRDEVVFLLTAVAEIKHALMVQYLFAAYSVRVVTGEPHAGELESVQRLLAQIAREAMSHLATVQNLLHLVGGPVHLNREHSPRTSEIYPFRFRLEGLTLGSLAKYVIAESPVTPPVHLPAEDVLLLDQIREDAARANDGQPVRHAGPLFDRIAHLLADVLADEDWDFTSRIPEESTKLIIDSFPGADVSTVRAAAVRAVRTIGGLGEGIDVEPAGPGNSASHFERFLGIYKQVKVLSATGTVITWPVVENPNTSSAQRAQLRYLGRTAVFALAPLGRPGLLGGGQGGIKRHPGQQHEIAAQRHVGIFLPEALLAFGGHSRVTRR